MPNEEFLNYAIIEQYLLGGRKRQRHERFNSADSVDPSRYSDEIAREYNDYTTYLDNLRTPNRKTFGRFKAVLPYAAPDRSIVINMGEITEFQVAQFKHALLDHVTSRINPQPKSIPLGNIRRAMGIEGADIVIRYHGLEDGDLQSVPKIANELGLKKSRVNETLDSYFGGFRDNFDLIPINEPLKAFYLRFMASRGTGSRR